MRKSKQDWLQQGLHTLAEDGLKGLKIDRLADRLGVTKGSFYHHFQNSQDYEKQLIAYWADQYLSTAVQLPQNPEEYIPLLDMLIEEAFFPITEPEIQIRSWAQQDEGVREYVELVDMVRHNFVRKIFEEVKQDTHQAALMADILFAILIGSMMTLPRIPSERVKNLYQEFKRLYGLRIDESS